MGVCSQESFRHKGFPTFPTLPLPSYRKHTNESNAMGILFQECGKQFMKMSMKPLNVEPELPSHPPPPEELPGTSQASNLRRLKREKINLWTGPKAIATLFSKELFVTMTRKQLLWLLGSKLKTLRLFLIENKKTHCL